MPQAQPGPPAALSRPPARGRPVTLLLKMGMEKRGGPSSDIPAVASLPLLQSLPFPPGLAGVPPPLFPDPHSNP